MSFSDEVLIAYADGELAEPVRSEVARAVQADPHVAARLARHPALRQQVLGAFGGSAREPVAPLLRNVGGTDGIHPKANVIDLAAARSARQTTPTLPSQMMPVTPPRLPQRWHRWAGFGVALALGGLLGAGALLASNDTVTLAQVGGVDGALVADGALDTALSKQLAHTAQTGPVRMGASFVAKDGNYCRSFQLDRAAGLACRNARRWQLAVLVQTPQHPPGTGRLAFSATPAVVAEAIDQRIAGAALDARGEQIALRLGWQR
jgi:anti-sigma factor RsiW